jgi:hypothetical protein
MAQQFQALEKHHGSMVEDRHGRAYLRLDQAQAGQAVELDDGFTCHSSGIVMLCVCADTRELFFFCDEGQHYISEQADDGKHCVGIYP